MASLPIHQNRLMTIASPSKSPLWNALPFWMANGLKLALLMLFFGGSLLPVRGQQATVTLSGNIALPVPKKVKRGSGYNKDGSAMMQSDDPMAQPENNIILSLHPLGHTPSLSPTDNAILTQKQQTFLPYVLPIVQGSTVYLLNEDEFFHNIYSLQPGSRFNIGRRPPGSPYALTISKLGPIKLSCDIHPHMEAFILSLDTPYFTRVQDQNRFLLSGIPPGKYELRAFHPRLRNWSKQITLTKNTQLSIDLTKQRARK